jgi:hypothetical protein
MLFAIPLGKVAMIELGEGSRAANIGQRSLSPGSDA